MTSNLVIGYPDILARATTTVNTEGAYGSNQKKALAFGPREPGFWLEDRTADDQIFSHAGSTSDAYNYFAITDAKYLKEGGVTTVVLQHGTSPFAPSSISGLKAWYDAGRGVTRDSSNLVTQWNDLSGNGYHLTASGSERPTWTAHSSAYNYNAAISFDGTANIMRNDSLALEIDGTDTSCTIATVAKAATTSGTRALMGFGREASANGYFRLRSTDGTNRDAQRTDDAGTATEYDAGTATTSYETVIWSFSGTDINPIVNNTSIGSGSINVGACSFDRAAVGGVRENGANAQFYSGYISEVLLYTPQISGANLTSLRNYLLYKHTTAPIYGSTGIASATLYGPRAEHLITTAISGTGSSNWYVKLGTSSTSRYRHTKQLLGSYLDLGRDPIWGRRSELISDATQQKRRRYKYEIRWEGLTLANTQTFISSIAEKADSTIFLLMTIGGYDPTLLSDTCVPVILTEYETRVMAPNTMELKTTWEEAI